MTMWSLFLDNATFAARRRKAQDSFAEQLHTLVADAIKNDANTEDLHDKIEELFATAYEDETGNPWEGPKSVVEKLQALVDGLLKKANPDSNVDATSLAIASLIINSAATRAAQDDEDDLFLEWVTMHDGAVREAHRATDGQVRPIGEKFDVDGTEMSMPGDVSAPIELWINCRCTVRPTIPPEFHSSETPFRDVGKDERDKRSKDGTAMPDGSYPIANCSDLKNAIQAIGRAKDPAKVKAHIKKRKRALGCPDVEIPDSWAMTVHTGAVSNYTIAYPPHSPTDPKYVMWTNNSTAGAFTMTAPTDEKPVEAEALERLAAMDEEQQAAFESLVPWHGVLAPEGVKTGDGRMFAENSLRNRDLPLPLTYQKSSDDGHKGSVTVGSIETIERVDGLMLATGFMLATEEADEVIGLMAHFGKYGVSVDTDDVEFEFDEMAEQVTFTSARICSASVVGIPAFAEAYIALGPWQEDAALVASGAIFKDLAPGKTEDGPGWLTHPVDTDRLRDYWVRGPGAAKIGWGSPGDFNRCRLELAKYVKPEYLSGYCANRHYDALGFWPGRPVAADTIPFDAEQQAPALTLVASAAQIKAPAAWFANPGFDRVTHVRVDTDGHFYGHVAEWGVCHIGITGVCTEAPKSETNYASFANKRVLLDDDTYARTGVITLGGKHAPGGLRAAAATQHYDDTTKAVADVAIGEDEFGIWVNGWVRPGVDPQDVYTLNASDVSGDWRGIDRFGRDLELVAVLAVNAGGFPVKAHADDTGMISLVAAGMIRKSEETPEVTEAETLAAAIAMAMERVEQNKKERAATMASLRDRYKED